MISSQPLVIGWIELAVAGTILLAATKLIVDRLRQPVDRVNLILLSMIITACVPLLLGFSSAPSLRLDLFSNYNEPAARIQTTNSSPARRQSPKSPDASVRQADHAEHQTTYMPPSVTHADSGTQESFSDGNTDTLKIGRVGNQADRWRIAAAILLSVHSVVIAWYLIEWIIGTIRLRAILRRAQAPSQILLNVWNQVSAGRGSLVRLLVTTEIEAPMVCDWRRPVVLIPAPIATNKTSALRYCLAHEWSHVSCGDLPRWQVTSLFQILFWYQPLYWMLRRELRISQDLIADDFAAGTAGDELGRIEYSELLMSIAKRAMNSQVAGGIAFYDRSSQLSRRIEMLIANEHSLRSRSTQAFCWMSGFVLLLVSLLIGSVRLSSVHAQAPDPDKPVETQSGAASESTNSEEPVSNKGEMKIVRGRIVNEVGQSVAGAKLWLPLSYQPRHIVQADADDAGNFELKCPAEWISSRVMKAWTVWVYAPGYSIQSQSVYEVVHGQSEKEFTIELPPESNTRFKVLSPEGQPMAGTLVQPMNYKTSVGYALVPEELQQCVSARTDKDGQIVLPAIEAGLLFRLEMKHEHFGRQIIRVDWSKGVPDRQIRLRPTASIRGQLVGKNPDWLRGVKLRFVAGNEIPFKYPTGIAEAVTDDEGHFEVPRIAIGGPLLALVTLDPELPVRSRMDDNLYLTAGETKQLEIPLVTAPVVRGKVVAKSTGNPVPNAEVILTYGKSQTFVATTDANGQYSGRALPGPVRVQILGVPDGSVQLGVPWEEPYNVPDNVDEFELPSIEVVGTHEVAGQLIDLQGQPIVNMKVMAIDANRRYGFGKSDAEGRFKMSVPDGIETNIVVYREDRGSEPVTVVSKEPLIVRYLADVREREMETKRRLRPEVTLVGHVLSSGKPAPNITIVLERGTPVIGSDRVRYAEVDETITDSNGNYRLKGLRAGDYYQIEINPSFPAADPTWHHQSPYVQRLSDDAKSEVVLPDVKLLKLTQSIAGVVVDFDGKPVKGAKLSVQLRSGQSLARLTDSGPPPWTQSDAQGRFQLLDLPEVPLSIMAYFANPEGGQIRFPAKLEVGMNQQDLRVVLDPSLQDDEEE